MSLLESSVLQIEQQSSQLEYQIGDESGRLIGWANQLAGPKPRKGLSRDVRLRREPSPGS
jgi:hypothetical protein